MKNVFLSLLLFASSILFSLELIGYISIDWMPQLYDPLMAELEKKSHNDLSREFDDFKKNNFLPYLGWQPPRNMHFLEKAQPYTYDAYGARVYKGYRREAAEIILVGDSYTYGHEQGDDETIAAQLYQRTGIISANLGFKAYDPVQSFLRVKTEYTNYPKAKIVIMGIMYENINRLVNSYRPALEPVSFGYEGFKPYMKDGRLVPLDQDYYRSLPDYLDAVKRAALETDYWAKPSYRFPYSLALIRGLTSHYFIQIELLPRLLRKAGRGEFEAQYKNKYLGDNLRNLINVFGQWAEEKHMIPVVVFIPRNSRDISSPQFWMERYQASIPGNVIMMNINFSHIDKERYNQRPNSGHPSAYGYRELARQYAGIIAAVVQVRHLHLNPQPVENTKP